MKFFYYRNETYSLELDYRGQVVCESLGIDGSTVEEVENKIRQKADAEKSAKVLPVYILRGDSSSYFEGKAKPINVGRTSYPEVWVSWRSDTKNRRGKLSASSVFLATPENREVLDQIVSLSEKMSELRDQRDALKETLTLITSEIKKETKDG